VLTVSSPAKLDLESEPPKAKPLSWTELNVIAEIKAYIAIRDDLLAEAEQFKTRAKLDGVTVANDFVQSCLNPARPPYHSQCLPEADAVRERKRCCAVNSRIAKLRSEIATA
jgi:hypothetical protein